MQRALADAERGYGARAVRIDDDALAHIARIAGGDARNALNALELAVESTPPDDDGVVQITLAVAQDSIQRRAVLYDKEGDAHYDTISAFIKSVRGSDPDAALYWLAKMLYAGEDPRFILRRLLILAGEDIGMADPNGLVVASAAAQAFEWMGMPEGMYPIVDGHAVSGHRAQEQQRRQLFSRAWRRSNWKARARCRIICKDANRDAKGLGHGEGYLYPHDFDGHYMPQNYLPREIAGMSFYAPGRRGL